jgi:hypothetical protein
MSGCPEVSPAIHLEVLEQAQFPKNTPKSFHEINTLLIKPGSIKSASIKARPIKLNR